MLRRNLKGAYTIWYRDVIRFGRDRPRIIAALAQPMLYLFVFGTGLGNMNCRKSTAPAGEPDIADPMALLSVAFIIPAVWQFGRQD